MKKLTLALLLLIAFYQTSFAFIGTPRYDDTITLPAQTALVGVTQWTLRQIRTTGIVAPHIADSDIFSVAVQMPHRKQQKVPIKSLHIHYIPVAAVTGNIVLNYEYGFYNGSGQIPDTLPNTGNVTINLVGSDQYKIKYDAILSNIQVPNETYSNILLVKVTRASSTYSGEIALVSYDCHIPVDRLGSVSETSD